MRTLIKNFSIFYLLILLGYIYFVFYVNPSAAPEVFAAETISLPQESIATVFTKEVQYWSTQIVNWANVKVGITISLFMK